jgi:aspartyl-tRNA(Asn)/glutamyl-tRNA(Gln) amidotransferase subunit A
MELLGRTITEIKEAIDKKEITAAEVKEYFNKRIDKYNNNLNIYLTRTEESDFEKDKGFSGIPIAVKDNYCTKGVETTAASNVLKGFVPEYDSTVTRKINEAGFDSLGKVNMDAWAHGSSGETSDFGPTANPWDTERVPGGSSSGSASAVSSYLAPIALGSETAGSIRLPASWTGIIGLKPTYGRVSRYGVIAMASSTDSPGPLTRSVEDAALALEVMAGKDLYDGTTVDAPVESYREEMKKNKKFKIGVAKEYMETADEDVLKRIDEAIKIFEKMGHEIKEVEMLDPKYAISVYTIIQRAEVSSNLARYHGIRYSNDRGEFGYEAKNRTMLGGYVLSHGYHDKYYKKAQKVRTMIVNNYKEVYQDVDLVIGPTTPITALKIGDFKKYPFFGEQMDILLEPSSLAGLPAISIPAGVDSKGLPVGLQIIGNYLKESDVLNLAYQFEQETELFGVMEKGLEKWQD